MCIYICNHYFFLVDCFIGGLILSDKKVMCLTVWVKGGANKQSGGLYKGDRQVNMRKI